MSDQADISLVRVTDYSHGLQSRITVTDYSHGLQSRITVTDYSHGLWIRSRGQPLVRVKDCRLSRLIDQRSGPEDEVRIRVRVEGYGSG